jgi:hypothetical protein
MGFSPSPLLASIIGEPKTVSTNPFVTSGIKQADIITDRMKKSVHDPFAALSAQIGGPGKTQGPVGPLVPMKVLDDRPGLASL